MSRVLDVYLQDFYAGQLVQNDFGVLVFTYDKIYVEQKKLALSLSLPLRVEPYEGNEAKAFFSGVLPDDIVRHRLARYLGVSEKNPFALLEAIGGECAGALSLYPEGQEPLKIKDEDREVLDDRKLKEILDLLKSRPLLAGEDGLRLSLAGAQDKIAIGLKDGKIVLIRGATPTTHILKPIISDVQDSVHNELFCTRLAKLVGIDVPHAEIHFLNGTPYFLIERYDREKDSNGLVRRLHQEDFCQALSIMPEMKYEREGGPSVSQGIALLQRNSITPAVDQLRFLDLLIFNYIIGNADAHGKNFSLLYKNLKPTLSPAYDLLCTAVYEEFSAKMAMKIGGKYRPEDVLLRHWHRLIPEGKAAERSLEKQLKRMAISCLEKAHDLKKTFIADGLKSPIIGKICMIVSNRVTHIMREL